VVKAKNLTKELWNFNGSFRRCHYNEKLECHSKSTSQGIM